MSYEPSPEGKEAGWTAVPGGEPYGSSLPRYVTRMIGRDADCARLRQLLLDQRHRVVVLTGIGGIGKTRLAVEVASRLEDEWRHGARFLSFAAVPRNTDLDAAFAWHLGLGDTQGQGYRESIRQHLQRHEQLLVVDNIEHLPELADLLIYIHQACAGISMLVTSRSELQVYGEVIHQLDPLPVFTQAAVLPRIQLGTTRESPAVRLLVDRARAIDSGFDLTDSAVPAVVGICDMLGGIPLALELIAPRLVASDPEALLSELRDTFDQAPGRAREPLEPAVTVQQTMRLSYDQLDERQQRVFRVLSIMYGQWSVDDVLPLLTPEFDELEALEMIEALVAKSLIFSPPCPAGEVRFTINPVLQHFGRSMLIAGGEHQAVADRHARRMVALAEEAEPELTGPNQQGWLTRLDALYDDFRHAHEHLRENDRRVDALRLATALWRYAYTRGHYRQPRGWIETSLGEISDHDALRAKALNGVGFLANVIGDSDGARGAHQRALELAQPLDLYREIATSRIGLADVAVTLENDTEAALHHLELAADAYQHLGEPRGEAGVLTNRGNIEWLTGDLDGAYATHEQARVLYEQASDIRGMAWSDTNTGRIAQQQGRYRSAVSRLLMALEGYLTIGDVRGIAEVLEALTGIAGVLGDTERASMLAGAAVHLRSAYDLPLKSPDLEEFQEALQAIEGAPEHERAFSRGKELDPTEVVALARSVRVPEIDEEPPDLRKIAHRRFGITPREHEVLTLMGEGLTDPQIAERLGLSRRTVQTYVSSILRKTKVVSRVMAVRTAHETGILSRTPWQIEQESSGRPASERAC
ncbi:MAG: LuxR C-terminal-related transcriptional regulator [Chloroflexota bacterium]|nr:LuxR C-terminal-related transcriptional regulator [Chloroflexota bacterium]